MLIQNYPFLIIRPGDTARPYLPVTIINPDSNITRIIIEKFSTQDVLIDFMPNLYFSLLGVRSFLGNFILTVDYPNKVFSLLLPEKQLA